MVSWRKSPASPGPARESRLGMNKGDDLRRARVCGELDTSTRKSKEGDSMVCSHQALGGREAALSVCPLGIQKENNEKQNNM